MVQGVEVLPRSGLMKKKFCDSGIEDEVFWMTGGLKPFPDSSA